LSPAHDLILVDARDIVEIKDELGEELLVVADPSHDGAEVRVGGSLHLFGRHLGLACRFELPREGSLRGASATNQTMTAGLGIVDLNHLLLLRGLAVEDITLLARVRALAFGSDGSCA
jgi:hypothetical protein